jgi:hypothetical protein
MKRQMQMHKGTRSQSSHPKHVSCTIPLVQLWTSKIETDNPHSNRDEVPNKRLEQAGEPDNLRYVRRGYLEGLQSDNWDQVYTKKGWKND